MVLVPGCLLEYFGDLVSVQTSRYNYSFSQARREAEGEMPLHMVASLKNWASFKNDGVEINWYMRVLVLVQ